ncbi:MAG: DUF2961 domain-containing protein [Phycisphaerae bacterium]|nr:DUF2961 domain-containing protein [Phycisphaerae bacterium]
MSVNVPNSVSARFALPAMILAGCSSLFAAIDSPAPPAASNSLLERLIRIPGQVQVLQTSSRNKESRNGDADMPLYKDARGDDVIFDAAGPGCIRSLWGTWFSHDAVLNFYFDGEQEPRYRINEIEFFSGKHPDFPAPLNSYELRGYYGDEPYAGNSFVPIPFAKSLKISVTGESRFFHVLYEVYPHGTPVASFTGREDRSSLLESFEHLGVASPSDSGGDVQTDSKELDGSNAEIVLLERKGGAGVVREIAMEADDSEALFQNTEVVMRWDGHMRDDVRAATGMFFGSANRAYDVASLPVTVKKLAGGRVRLDCRFPMPFWREARIAFRNLSGKPLGRLDSRIVVGPNPVPEADGAYFTALYHKGETTYGRDWPLYDSPGAGWFVGVVQSMQHQHYCEGNEHFYIDGAVSPQINGTGSEDYYLGCFWPNRQYSSPFATCAGDIQLEAGGDTRAAYAIPASYTRFHLEAPIPFFRSIDARIQHGAVSNIASNYRSLAFCYLRRRPALRQTDFLDVGNATSEKAHDYSAGCSELTGLVAARPEGEYFETAEDENGRRHPSGEIQFTVAIDPQNGGVRIRRRLDQKGRPQAARVFVNGAYAGTWRYAYQNESLRWFDSDFDISPQYTRDKASLRLKLEVIDAPDCGEYSEFNYKVFCFERRTGLW